MTKAGWLAAPRAQRVAVVLGVLATLPALRVGLLHDDLLHRLALEGSVPGFTLAAHELYDFTGDDPATVSRMIERGYLPWWTDPALSLRFFRPLSSLLLALDDALFGRDPLLAHVHSLAWFVLMALVVAAIHRRALSPTSATVATAIYALAGAHAMTTSWLAARHTLIGACFGALCVLSYLRGRAEGWRAGAALAPLALIAGMLASETALGAVVFVVLYELIVARDEVRRRVIAAAPVLGLGVAHLAFYALSRYGTHESGTYLSPFDDPLAFAGAIVTRGPLLVAEMFGAFPVLVSGMDPAMALPIGVYGAVSSGACAFLLVRARAALSPDEARRLIWLGSASILCLAPMVGGVLGPRLLPLASMGSAAVVGAALVEGWRLARSRAGVGRLALRSGVIALTVLHLGASPLLRVTLPTFLASMAEAERALATQADASACPERAHAFLLTGADPAVSLYGFQSIFFYEPEKASRLSEVYVVSMVAADQEVEVLDDDTFTLRVLDPAQREANLFERVYRAAPLAVGQRVEAGTVTATVRAMANELPTEVAFDVEGGLSSACFLVWRDGQLRAIPPPAPGAPIPIPHEPGPMGL